MLYPRYASATPLLLLVVLMALSRPTQAWTSTTLSLPTSPTRPVWVGSAVSGFAGRVVVFAAVDNAQCRWTMKKGKANVPPQMRSQYTKQREMMAQREQMMAATKQGSDGLPVFNLFVRTKRANMWYPCGSFKGDDRSRALAKNYADGGLLAGISKKQMDTGIAGSLYQDQNRLKESIVRTYPQLRSNKEELEFGYRLAFDGLTEEQSKETKIIVPKENKGLVDNIKSIFS